MSIAAFILVAFMLTAYVLLDGYDLGIAAITPLVARTDEERASTMHAIGPFWNGNEVWLIAAGGALFALFPQAYASAFSGFYLPFMVVLWLLMFRGVAMELRGHFPSAIWHSFWDTCFAGASALLILLFGVALGNLLRGLPLDTQGYFQGTFAHLLNPYALLVGVFAVAALAQHGACFLLARIDGVSAQRARSIFGALWTSVAALYVVTTIATFFTVGARAISWIDVVTIVTLASLIAVRAWIAQGRSWLAFAASSLFVASLLVQAAGTLYPYLLPRQGGGGLSIFAASPAPGALASALTVTIVGTIAVVVYGTLVLPKMAGKLREGE